MCVFARRWMHRYVCSISLQICVFVCVQRGRLWGWADLCVSVYNWRQRENLWTDICSWFLVIINQVSFSAGVLPQSSPPLSSVLTSVLHTLFSSSPPSHFLSPVETQGLAVKFLQNFGLSLTFWVATQLELWKLLPGQRCSERKRRGV